MITDRDCAEALTPKYPTISGAKSVDFGSDGCTLITGDFDNRISWIAKIR